jgi:hypothetical protein
MSLNNLSDRSCETTKLLRRCQGVFSKARRTLTSPPQFRIARLSGPEGFTTTALLERKLEERTNGYKYLGTVTPAHNWKYRNSDAGKIIWPDWKPSPFFYKGTWLCKRYTNNEKRFLPGCNHGSPIYRYISDRRPRGLSPLQLDVVLHRVLIRRTITLIAFLNGTAGYRTDSEDSIKSPGRYCRIRTEKVQNSMR